MLLITFADSLRINCYLKQNGSNDGVEEGIPNV
jgi:hypothetical protein